jgi:propionyl-CoA carboxylase beta chain
MGAEGAINILFRDEIASAPDPIAARTRLTADYRRKFSSPYTAASLGVVDDVIEPSETRLKIIAGLEALAEKQVPLPQRKHGNMPV